MNTQEKGARLEQQVAAYFRLNGYEVEQNVKIEGKSGGIHEIDVWARKWDGITDFILAVECKAWATPIEKDVVSKLSMVLADTGINKGIIVALHGWRSGAETAARQEKIELWGPAELTEHLGSVMLADLNAASTNRLVVAAPYPVRVAEQDLRKTLDTQSRGLFGTGREDRVWEQLAWVPFHQLELHLSTVVREFLRRPTTKVTTAWALYNALDNRHYFSTTESMVPAEIQVPVAISPKTTAKPIGASLVNTLKKYQEVTRESSKARYRTQLQTLGVPDTVVSLTVEHATIVHLPFWVGLFHRRGTERLVAINAHTGTVDGSISQALTKSMAFVRAAMEPDDH